MAFRRAGATLLAAVLAVACGSEDDANLGSGSDGGAGTGGSAGSGSAGQGNGGGAGNAGASGGPQCTGTHPLVDAGIRFCAPGECRCESDDTCYPQADAARCCTGQLRCFTPDGGVTCEGRHPQVDGSARFCDAGDCYCSANDTCYPAAIAALCCGLAPQCG